MIENALNIIHISDTHLFGAEDKSLLGVKTKKSLTEVIELIKKEKQKIDFILHSGDVSQDGSEASYRLAAELFSTLNVPVYCVPGNHDDAHVMKHVYPLGCMSNKKNILTNNWQFILLNSQQRGEVYGYLDQQQLDDLEYALKERPMHHAVIMFHHQPVSVGSAWLDKLGLTNAGEFWEIVSRYPQVSLMLFGHVHQEDAQIHDHVQCFSAPSTCIQFQCKQHDFGLQNISQGYRWLSLDDDGKFETRIVRLPEYSGHYDKDAKGY